MNYRELEKYYFCKWYYESDLFKSKSVQEWEDILLSQVDNPSKMMENFVIYAYLINEAGLSDKVYYYYNKEEFENISWRYEEYWEEGYRGYWGHE